MYFQTIPRQIKKIITGPLAAIYSLLIWIRNFLYEKKLKKIYTYKPVIISVGNLIVGGSGKTPCVSYLANILSVNYTIGIISRGYKRTTRGYRLATSSENASTLGDEPYQLYQQFKNKKKVHIAVGERKAKAITRLLQSFPEIDAILLDDGFQHRSVGRSINILVTSFHQPFFADHVLPMGKLREPRSSAKRADIILVTKCPERLKNSTRSFFKEQILKYSGKVIPIFFAHIKYNNPRPIWNAWQYFNKQTHVLLITGIANAEPLVPYIARNYKLTKHISFPDHYRFTTNDIKKLLIAFHQINSSQKCILTTEKDSVRLKETSLADVLKNLPIFFIPINMEIRNEEKETFEKTLINSLNKQ